MNSALEIAGGVLTVAFLFIIVGVILGSILSWDKRPRKK